MKSVCIAIEKKLKLHYIFNVAEISARHRQELQLILEANTTGKRLNVNDLQRTVGVSTGTIYSDLDFLSKLRVVRNRGSIELASEPLEQVPSRFQLRADSKNVTAAEVVQNWIPFGAVTYLDTGSTCLFIAQQIVANDRQDIRLITANPFALQVCVSAGIPAEVVVLGGQLRREAASLHGPLTQHNVKQFAFDVAIMSVDFIHADADVTLATFSDAEVEQKRIAISHASHVVVAADSTKLTRSLGHPVIALKQLLGTKQVTLVIGCAPTETEQHEGDVQRLRRILGGDVVRVVCGPD